MEPVIMESDNNSCNNATNDGTYYEDLENDFHELSIVLQVVLALVCIVGLLGNTLVIFVVLRYSKMQTVTNMYIVNLAIADLCFLLGIPFYITNISLRPWTFGSFMCKAYVVSTNVNQFTSSIFLFIMSVDRYIAVCHPISAPRLRTPFVSRVVSAAAWTVSTLVLTPIFMHTTIIVKPNGASISCILEMSEEGFMIIKKFLLYNFVLGYTVPLVMMFVFYWLVIKKLQNIGPINKSKEKKRSHRKVTKLVLAVLAVYVICWLPYWVFHLMLFYSSESFRKMLNTLHLVIACFGYSNSAINPILYAFLSDNFKKSFLKACTCAAGQGINATLHVERPVVLKMKQGALLEAQGQALTEVDNGAGADGRDTGSITALTSSSVATSNGVTETKL